MKVTAVLIQGGLVQAVYKVDNAPRRLQGKILIIDEDNLRESDNRPKEASEMLEGYEMDGEIKFDEIFDELSSHVTDQEVRNFKNPK